MRGSMDTGGVVGTKPATGVDSAEYARPSGDALLGVRGKDDVAVDDCCKLLWSSSSRKYESAVESPGAFPRTALAPACALMGDSLKSLASETEQRRCMVEASYLRVSRCNSSIALSTP